jgi:hypothetical protein
VQRLRKQLEEAWSQAGSSLPLVEIHSNWATASVWIFGVLSLVYLAAWLHREGVLKHAVGSWCERALSLWFTPVVALAGLAAITITGALGGAIVYGPDVDPAVKFIYSLVVPT